MKYHHFSIEKLYHFRCFECNKWWSVGDWKFTEKMVCPHCGRVAIVIEEKTTPNVKLSGLRAFCAAPLER